MLFYLYTVLFLRRFRLRCFPCIIRDILLAPLDRYWGVFKEPYKRWMSWESRYELRTQGPFKRKTDNDTKSTNRDVAFDKFRHKRTLGFVERLSN